MTPTTTCRVSDRLRLVVDEVRRPVSQHHRPRSLAGQRNRVQVRQQHGHKGSVESVDAKAKRGSEFGSFPLAFGSYEWDIKKGCANEDPDMRVAYFLPAAKPACQ